eukprot:Nk52_evm1s1126 gene=Nk52_evmTU1s1126
MSKSQGKGKEPAGKQEQPVEAPREEATPPYVLKLEESIRQLATTVVKMDNRMDNRMESLDNRMEAIEQNFGNLDKRVNKLELTMELSESASMVGNMSPGKRNKSTSNHGNEVNENKTFDNSSASSNLSAADKPSDLGKSSASSNPSATDKPSDLGKSSASSNPSATD